jgi:hypothetical protein
MCESDTSPLSQITHSTLPLLQDHPDEEDHPSGRSMKSVKSVRWGVNESLGNSGSSATAGFPLSPGRQVSWQTLS